MEKFNDIFEDCTSRGTKIKTDEYQENGRYAIVDQGQKDIAGYTDQTNGVYEDVPAIIFGDHTRIIKYIDTPFFLGADGVKLLKAKKENANYKYLYYALKHVNIPDTGYNRHFKWLKESKIKYPDSMQQQNIVDVLDKVESIIENRKCQIEELDNLIKARFVEMFGGINNSTLYPYIALKKITDVVSGGTPNRSVGSYWMGGTIPWVKTTELKNCVIAETEEKITLLGLNNSSAKIVPANTILVAMYGQGKTRGMTGYLQCESATNQACACILPSKCIDTVYLWKYIMLSYDILRGMAKGGNQPNLNGEIIKNFPVLMPPRELQQKFTAFVTQIDKAKVALQKSMNETQLLFGSFMEEYFG